MNEPQNVSIAGEPPRIMDAGGRPVEAGDPTRLIWFSSSCSFWTDNFAVLKRFGPGIPCCPHCEAPGFQTDAADWENGARVADEREPKYLEFLNANKEKCRGAGVTFQEAWNAQRAKGSAGNGP